MRNKLAGWCLLPCLWVNACSNQTVQPITSPVASPSTSPSPVAIPVALATPVIEVDHYHDALNTASAARSVSETALAKEDWALVASQWQASINLLKTVPKNSTNYPLAQKILPQYQQNLFSARQKSSNFKPKANEGESKASVLDSTDVSGAIDQSKSFSLPIIKKLNNIPVVEVVINGRDRVQMLLDTGASKTLITKGTATRLQLASVGQTKAMTANGDAKFDTVKLDSVEFGQGKVTDLTVAVGNDDQNYGLLGHDVYKGYDITLTEDTIEFKKR
jgi:clan AA aspartic protease (TIGR02281 family)